MLTSTSPPFGHSATSSDHTCQSGLRMMEASILLSTGLAGRLTFWSVLGLRRLTGCRSLSIWGTRRYFSTSIGRSNGGTGSQEDAHFAWVSCFFVCCFFSSISDMHQMQAYTPGRVSRIAGGLCIVERRCGVGSGLCGFCKRLGLTHVPSTLQK